MQFTATGVRKPPHFSATMPNNNRRGGREKQQHFFKSGHDDRLYSDQPRRVSFKDRGGHKKKHNRQKDWDQKMIRTLFLDDDIDMLGPSGGRSDRPRDFPGGRFENTQRMKRNRRVQESPSSWYKVTIRYGNRYEKNYLLKLLCSHLRPLPFIPYGYKVGRDEVTFMIEDHRLATELSSLDRRVAVNDGYKLSLNVRSINPLIELDDKLTATIKQVLANRFNAMTLALDLSKFHADEVFKNADQLCPLNRPNIMLFVLDVIGESTPQLNALNLNDNNLNATEHMKVIVEKLPNLKVLHLENNKLRDAKLLDPLKGLPLEDVILDGNPLCDRYPDKDSYIRAVRERFPKVIKLDKVDLPPPILFDIEEEAKLPPTQASFMCDGAGSEMAKTFIEQYYCLYDSPSREPLVQAYHENASFSLDCYFNPGDANSQLGIYMQESRNLQRVSNSDRRARLLRRGKTRIMELLSSLPSSQHYPASFTVDLVIFTPQLIQLFVTGVFKEEVPKKQALYRYFSRAFVIIPAGTGFCIVNEQLTIVPASQDQIRKIKLKETAASASSSTGVAPAPAAGASSNVGGPPPPAPPVPDLETKHQMVTALSVKTGMNLPWSEKCLVETNWNFDQAVFAFMEIQKQGTIPPEAFVK